MTKSGTSKYLCAGNTSQAWIRPAIAAVSVKPTVERALLSHFVGDNRPSGLMLDTARSTRVPDFSRAKFTLIGSRYHLGSSSLERTPSVQVVAKNYSNNSAVDLCCAYNAPRVKREKYWLTMRVYRFLPIDVITFGLLKPTTTIPSLASTLESVECLMPLRRPFAMEHPLHPPQSPLEDNPLPLRGLA